MKKSIPTILSLVLLFNLTACGTMLHPERKGQTSGDIDTNIAVLNGIGLLFFVIPGVIAYVVDFNNGTIYLPNSSSSLDLNTNTANMTAIKLGTKGLTKESIETVIAEKTGSPVSYDEVEIYKIDTNGTKVRIN